MNNDDELYNNLVTLLKLFKNRPYHLSKYLIENSALDDNFIKKILNSDNLKRLQEQSDIEHKSMYFPDITKMQDFYSSLSQISDKKDMGELFKELNEKMNKLILDEKYEEAATLRDYMEKNKIKRKK